MEEHFKSQLVLLNERGALNESEVKKIGEMNAELFGHSNSRQKIKHVAQLKEENVKLKKVCFR
jgi:Hyaluronan mediated motility receptor C-terminal